MQDDKITLGSLFDGLGGWQIAAIRNGVVPIWSSEVEKFPLALTKERFPKTKQVGDIIKLKGSELEPVDIITFGSPCQNLSVSGNRKGLKGEKSSIFGEAVRLIFEMREKTGGEYPKYAVWENVCGAFSSNGGMDFREILRQLSKTEVPMPRSGKWSRAGMVRGRLCNILWRVLDAQFFGVPQHRERIFLIVDYTKRGYTNEILFESEGMQRHLTESKENKEEITRGVEKSFNNTSTLGFDSEASRINVGKDKTPTLRRSTHISIFDMTHTSDVIRERKDITQTLNTRMGTGGNQVPVTYTTQSFSQIKESDISATITAKETSVRSYIKDCKYLRRLTPLECERLQGLPDNWTLIEDKTCSDSARYKAIGNGMAQPCADFIMSVIANAERLRQEENKDE